MRKIKKIKISEIFASIQGESTLQGLPTVFVRIAGCNLNCRYCDTRYAKSGGTEMSIGEICKMVEKSCLSYVCITGGEPLLDSSTPVLACELINRGLRVSVETNGTLDTSELHEDVIRIIDIKCPGSGEHGKTHPHNLSHPGPNTEFKFVLTNRADFDYARDFVKKHGLADARAVLLSPVEDALDQKQLAEWIVNEMPEARLNLQIHKIIWPDELMGR